jgi:hypothetical protein
MLLAPIASALRAQTLHALTTTSVIAIESASRYARSVAVQRDIESELTRIWHARRAPALPAWSRVLRATEHQAGLSWKGPTPSVLIVADLGHGFGCPEGMCDGRFEGSRVVFGGDRLPDTIVVGVILLAESVMLSEEVWQHELTHALLAQHGLLAESTRHDPRYFRSTRGVLASRQW